MSLRKYTNTDEISKKEVRIVEFALSLMVTFEENCGAIEEGGQY